MAKEVSLEISHRFGLAAAELGAPVSLPGMPEVKLQRLDYLLSDFALETADTKDWIQSEDLAAYLSLREGRCTARLGFVPPKKFSAIRFRVGVDEATNAADPNRYPPDHPLNPQVNDLHWGWSGGYVFVALEGMVGDRQGFSYHLANDGNAPVITLPVEFDTSRDCTIHLAFDIGRFFTAPGAIDLARDSRSSHSREGDPLPAKMQAALAGAFQVSAVSHDQFQSLTPSKTGQQSGVTSRGTPYPMQVTTRFPQVALPADNRPTLEGVALGEALFSDKRLSEGNIQSCASCHNPANAFADGGKRVSTGVTGIGGRRNSPPLFNLAWHDGYFWDGRAKTLREQVLMPISDPHEMNAKLVDVVHKLGKDEQMLSEFATAFGSPEPTADNIARALEQYLLTLISQDSKFDRAIRKEVEFTPEEQRGLELFVTEHDPERQLFGADCFHCHGGHLFTSRRFTNNGLDAGPATDLGRSEVTGQPGDLGKFKTPSLRNIAVTAPYMHDGRFATLEEVVDHYDHGVQRSPTLDPNLAKHPAAGLGLSDADKHALVAFLRTLTDQQFQSQDPGPGPINP